MNAELEQKLYDKYPKLLRNVYFETGDGWYTLLDRMFNELKGFDIYFCQIKQKFAGLRAYYYPSDPNVEFEHYKKIDDIIKKYEVIASKTCEECGKPAKRESCSGWLMTLCADHYNEWKSKHGGS